MKEEKGLEIQWVLSSRYSVHFCANLTIDTRDMSQLAASKETSTEMAVQNRKQFLDFHLIEFPFHWMCKDTISKSLRFCYSHQWGSWTVILGTSQSNSYCHIKFYLIEGSTFWMMRMLVAWILWFQNTSFRSSLWKPELHAWNCIAQAANLLHRPLLL